jgi:hypothetical protein
MDEHCIEACYGVLNGDGEAAEVLRFDGCIVDEHDRIIDLLPANIERESWLEFAYGYVTGWRHCFLQQLVFRRSALDRIGGFLDLPLGWTADFAAAIALGRESSIRRIPGPRVQWRQSRKNISPDRSITARKNKIRADCLFLQWLRDQLDTPREHLFEGDDIAFGRAMDRLLLQDILVQGSLPSISNWRLLSETRQRVTGGERATVIRALAMAAVTDSFSYIGRAARRLAARPSAFE